MVSTAAGRSVVFAALVLAACSGSTPTTAGTGALTTSSPTAAVPTSGTVPVMSASSTSTSAPDAPVGGRLGPGDLVYVGAFRLPPGPEDSGWAWSGEALTYRADGDPDGPDDGHPGSLIGTGHNWYQLVSEITIPTPVISTNLDDLPVAETLQPFADIRGGLFDFDSFEIPRTGLEYLDGRLHFTWGQHFEDTGPAFTHGWATPELSAPQTHGPWRIGPAPLYATNDYLFSVDPTWSADHLGPGPYLATGRFRDGGWAGMGPSLYLYQPPTNQPPRTELPSTPLLQYDTSHNPTGTTLSGYHHSDEWTGGAWIQAAGRTAVIIAGTKGLGDCWYGFANGIQWPDQPPYPPIPPPPNNDRGWWSTTFEAQILFYDPTDLAAVTTQQQTPNQPQPYATLTIDHTLHPNPTTKHRVAAIAYNPQTNHLYILQPQVDNHQPIIHTWAIQTPDA